MTSDILRIVLEDQTDHALPYAHRKNPTVFRYPQNGPPETKPFLFTGILTLRKAIEENLDTVLAVLGAIEDCIEFLSQPRIDDYFIECLAKHDHIRGHLDGALGLQDGNKQKEVVRDALNQMRNLGIYPRTILPDRVGFSNAAHQWKNIVNRPSTVEWDRYVDDLPAVLLTPPRWLEASKLQNAVLDKMEESVLRGHPRIKELLPEKSRLTGLFWASGTLWLLLTIIAFGWFYQNARELP